MEMRPGMRFIRLVIVLSAGLALTHLQSAQAFWDDPASLGTARAGVAKTPVLPVKMIAGQKIIPVAQASKPAPASNRVIVKVNEGVDVKAVLARLKINGKLRTLHSAKPTIARFKKAKGASRLSARGYAFGGKYYKSLAQVPDAVVLPEAYAQVSAQEKALLRSYVIDLPVNMTLDQGITKLRTDPGIAFAEPDRVKRVLWDDPYLTTSGSWQQAYEDLWGIKKINALNAWTVAQGLGVVVAVIDTGVDYAHPDLVNQMWTNSVEIPNNQIDDDSNGYVDDVYGYNFDGGDANPMDAYGHGTHCAGTVAAEGNNGVGVIGVAPKARIMALKGLGDTGSGVDSNLVQAIRYAADNGAQVISNSWGGAGEASQALTDAVHYANTKGCVVIAAAGNSNAPVEGFEPANIDTVIAVAASTPRDERASFSNYGAKIDVTAPGGGYTNELGTGGGDMYNILSTMPDTSVIATTYPAFKVANGYYRLAGTSMACPHVSGVAALILSQQPSLTPEQVRQILRSSADDVAAPGFDTDSGAGRINAARALSFDPATILTVGITSPASGAVIAGSGKLLVKGGLDVTVTGNANGTGFVRSMLYYGVGSAPRTWIPIPSSISLVPVTNGVLGKWPINGLADGVYQIKILAVNTAGFAFEATQTVTLKGPDIRLFPLRPVRR